MDMDTDTDTYTDAPHRDTEMDTDFQRSRSQKLDIGKKLNSISNSMSEKYPVRTRTRNLDKVFILRTVFRLGTLQEPRELRWVGKPFGTCCLCFKLVLAKKTPGLCLLFVIRCP